MKADPFAREDMINRMFARVCAASRKYTSSRVAQEKLATRELIPDDLCPRDECYIDNVRDMRERKRERDRIYTCVSSR